MDLKTDQTLEQAGKKFISYGVGLLLVEDKEGTFELWKQTYSYPGYCLKFLDARFEFVCLLDNFAQYVQEYNLITGEKRGA